jgi:predicted O-linked N-acetylglucosamine transferase (SPINDLY family)/glycosyltransferase involved in cell wall biosynthesis
MASSPLFSVLMFCRNGGQGIRKSIESVLGQTYPNIQYVVQDGASTDDTIDIIRSYGSRVELVSEPDSGTNEGFWRALMRCRGKYVGSCLADEALLPGAIERAVEEFEKDRSIGAVTGDAYLWNEHGTIFGTHVGQEFDLLGYLMGDYCPNFSASFFRRSALQEVGLFDRRWKRGALDTVEFEIWCRLGTEHRVKYVSYIFSKYGIHENQMSQKLPRILGELDSRRMIIDDFLFGETGFFGDNTALRDFILRRQYEIIVNHLLAYKREEQAAEVKRRMGEAVKKTVVDRTAAAFDVAPAVRLRSARTLQQLRRLVPASARRAAPLSLKLAFERRLQDFYALRGTPIPLAKPFSPAEIAPQPSREQTLRRGFYHQTALIYASRGQVDQAWKTWQHGAALENPSIASNASQLLAKLPSMNEAKISAAQQRWADKHAVPSPFTARHEFSPPRGRKIAVAYHCAFWSTACARAQALSFIAAHDRSRFRIVGYSPTPEASGITSAFDSFIAAGVLDDKEFAESVRREGIDVFVELTGLSPDHRFGAMARRCAPVQISYLNHHASSRVANVDYIIADKISAPSGSDIHYTEEIYRLPRCFFSFRYDTAELPPIAPSPHLTNGYVTFGCFGSGEKLNDTLLALWADVLRAVPNARLLLQNHGLRSPANRRYLESLFGRVGISPDRLILVPGTDRAGVLDNYGKVDISLDTWPYAGGNTIAESVWQGVPVIALRGDRLSSAYGASLVAACGLGELVASSFEEYVQIAARLASDLHRLVVLRSGLRAMLQNNDFGNPISLARALEDAYVVMLAKRWNGAGAGSGNDSSAPEAARRQQRACSIEVNLD